MLFIVPIGRSFFGRGTVTMPGLAACVKWRWSSERGSNRLMICPLSMCIKAHMMRMNVNQKYV